MNRSSKYNKLNAKQVHALKLVHKFRFITAPLFASYKNLSSRSSMYTTLEILVRQQYLGKRSMSNTGFQNKGGRYYLTPAGLKLLRSEHGFSDSTVSITHKNNKISEEYVDRYVDTLRIYLSLRNSHGKAFHVFAASELLDYDYFPAYQPDLYLNRIRTVKNKAGEYLLYNLANTQFYIFKKRFDRLLEHFDSGEWEVENETPYPALLLVCADGAAEKRLQEHVTRVMDNAGIDDLKVLTTSYKALVDSPGNHNPTWTDITDPGKLVSLK